MLLLNEDFDKFKWFCNARERCHGGNLGYVCLSRINETHRCEEGDCPRILRNEESCQQPITQQ